MKICAISDIHGYLPEIPECDILCICGDIVPLDIQRKMDMCISWLAGPFQSWALSLPCKNVLMIWGNHDFIGEHLLKEGNDACGMERVLFQNDSQNKIHILCDNSDTIGGIKFYGTSWCPGLTNWAFYGNRNDLLTMFNQIPDDVDILLTHCPPKYGLQGVVLETNWNYMTDFGCVELQEVIDNKLIDKDFWVLSGHIHSGKHSIEKLNNIKYRNCSIKDENYEVTFEPFVFEISK